jgi:hypothetical protein
MELSEGEKTMYGENIEPNLEKERHVAWPRVRYRMDSNSGVATQVVFWG